MKYTVNTTNGPVSYDTPESIVTAFRDGSLRDSNVLHPDDGSPPVAVRLYLEQSGHQAVLSEPRNTGTTRSTGTSAPVANAPNDPNTCPKCASTDITATHTRPPAFIGWLAGFIVYLLVAYRNGILGVVLAVLTLGIVQAVLSAVFARTHRTCNKCYNRW